MLKPYMIPGIPEAGCDEAGRGPLAGSVFCAAVVLPRWEREEDIPDWARRLNDSKQLSEREREELRPLIEQGAEAWAVVEMTPAEIDQLNILWASVTGMQRALARVYQEVPFRHILVDGNKWRPFTVNENGNDNDNGNDNQDDDLFGVEIPANTVVHGDATYMAIAAASVLAKTYRDEYMLRLHEEYPQYGWDQNKGYPTAKHYQALRQYGPTPYHRLTFNLKINN